MTLSCVYCDGKYESDDHIPPKAIFSAINKKNLITVPSCIKCNGGFSKDDEYFRFVLTSIKHTENHADVEKLRDKVHKIFTRAESKKFAKSIIKTIEITPNYTSAGIFTGFSPTFEFNKDRMLNVAKRITKGLYYHERGEKIPDNFQVLAYWAGDFANDVSDVGKRLRNLSQYVYTQNHKIIGNNVFQYWYSFLDEYDEKKEGQSVWLYRFYDEVDILSMTVPKG